MYVITIRQDDADGAPAKPAATPPKPAAQTPASPAAAPVPGIAPERRIKAGDADRNGDLVADVYVDSDQFVVYATVETPSEHPRLRYVLPDSYEAARAMRAKLAPIAGETAFVIDALASIVGRRRFGAAQAPQTLALRSRTFDLLARGLQAALEEQPEAAQALVAHARAAVVSRRDSRNRMRYIAANVAALSAILAVWITGGVLGYALPSVLTEPAFGARPIDVLVMGALGAFFSVSAAINAVRVDHAISSWEMAYAGFVRVPIGVIAAGVTVFLVTGGWILAGVAEPYRASSLHLFGFLAGFSEFFVPNALKQVEESTKASAPGSSR